MRTRFLAHGGMVILALAVAGAALLVPPASGGRPESQREGWPPAAADAVERPGLCCRLCLETAGSWDDRRTPGWEGAARKIDPESASLQGCEPPAAGLFRGRATVNDRLAQPFTAPAAEVFEKQGRVAAMVEQALDDQVEMLQTRQAELEEWDRQAQVHFARWFGTTSQKAQVLIYRRIKAILKINAAYSARNFRRAVPSRNGVYAYVHAHDPSKVYLDRVFVQAPAVGVSSRAGTITHEMSHFRIAGGTRDHAYGPRRCKALARTSPLLALTNADNFEFYIEGVQ